MKWERKYSQTIACGPKLIERMQHQKINAAKYNISLCH